MSLRIFVTFLIIVSMLGHSYSQTTDSGLQIYNSIDQQKLGDLKIPSVTTDGKVKALFNDSLHNTLLVINKIPGTIFKEKLTIYGLPNLNVLWSKNLNNFSGRPKILDSLLVFIDGKSTIMCDIHTGKTIFDIPYHFLGKTENPDVCLFYESPDFFSNKYGLYCINVRNNKTIWNNNTLRLVGFRIIELTDKILTFSSLHDGIVSINMANGKLWQRPDITVSKELVSSYPYSYIYNGTNTYKDSLGIYLNTQKSIKKISNIGQNIWEYTAKRKTKLINPIIISDKNELVFFNKYNTSLLRIDKLNGTEVSYFTAFKGMVSDDYLFADSALYFIKNNQISGVKIKDFSLLPTFYLPQGEQNIKAIFMASTYVKTDQKGQYKFIKTGENESLVLNINKKAVYFQPSLSRFEQYENDDYFLKGLDNEYYKLGVRYNKKYTLKFLDKNLFEQYSFENFDTIHISKNMVTMATDNQVYVLYFDKLAAGAYN
jgi:hypothetical protein